jgi:hypothetical protein
MLIRKALKRFCLSHFGSFIFFGRIFIYIFFFILHLVSGAAESPTVGLDGAGILLHQFKETKGSLLILLCLGLLTVYK